MADIEYAREKMPLGDVPKGYVVELIGFKDGKEVGIGLRGVVASKFVRLMPLLDLEKRVRVEILFGDGRELQYPGKFEIFCLGDQKQFPQFKSAPVVPGLRPLRKLVG